MGFFFSDDKKPKSNNIELAKEHGCNVCPRKKYWHNIKSPDMQPTGSKKPILYIVGESPGAFEDQSNTQFVGESGALLTTNLINVFGREYPQFTRMNNTVRCFKNNETPTPFEIECCKSKVIKDIEDTKPHIVIGTGSIPLKAFLNGSRITQWRGRLIPKRFGKHDCWFMPVFHPAFLVRKKPKYGISEEEKSFIYDLKLVKNFLDSYKKPLVISSGYSDNIEVITTVDREKIFNCLNKLLNSNNYPLSIDIETKGLKPHLSESKLLTMAVSNYANTVAFPIDESIKDLIGTFLLTNASKLAHNLKFELEWFYKWLNFDQRFMRTVEWNDTMLMAHILDERTSKDEGMYNLDVLSQIHLGFNLKELTTLDKLNLDKEPIDKVLLYNGMDAKYTRLLYDTLLNKMNKTLHDIYKSLVKTTITLTVTESRGITINVDKVNELHNIYEKEIESLERQMKGLPEVEELIQGGVDFNPRSSKHLEMLFANKLKLKQIKATVKGKYSTDDEVLTYWAERDILLAKLLLRYRKIYRLKSTYVDIVKDNTYEGILHPNFNLSFTKTGRFSSGRE